MSKANTEISGAEIVIRALVEQGVDTVFGYPGGAILPVYDALFKQNALKHVLVRHEQAAVHAAEGYARSTGKVGAVFVTSGPGATNTVTGLMDALLDSIPLVCISGQVPRHLIGTDAFQEADVTGITRPCTKHNYLVKDVSKLAHVIHEAFHVASTGRPGPVVVDVPKDVMNMTGRYKKPNGTIRPSYKPAFAAPKKPVEDAVKLMAKAKRPVFYVGGGVINAGDKACEDLRKLVRKTGFPITQTLMGLGAYPDDDPQFLNMLGMHGSLEANMAMAECDVMINIGARFDDRVTGRLDGFSRNSKKIHVDIDASSINKNVPVDIPIVADAGEVITQMLELWNGLEKQPDKKALAKWWERIDGWRAKNSYAYAQPKTGIIKPQHAIHRLCELSKDRKTFITTDVGQHQMWAAQHFKFNDPRRWMTSGGLGTMGYGFPAAFGVQMAHPKALVACITGESSILMNIQELSTVAQYRLPVKIVILNNGYMGMVRQWQQMFHGGRYSESYMDSLPDFVKLAEAYGLDGVRATKVEELDDVLLKMMDTPGAVIADIHVDKEENVFPMIPAGAAHNEILLGPEGDATAESKSNLL